MYASPYKGLLRLFLESKRNDTEKGYVMRVSQENFALDYLSARILRVDSGLRYVVYRMYSKVL